MLYSLIKVIAFNHNTIVVKMHTLLPPTPLVRSPKMLRRSRGILGVQDPL